MKVTQIKLLNIMGLADAEINPGQVTIIQGKNGVGKSSIASAISSIVQGGHDASLLRAGEKEGQAVIVFDDGTVINKTITENTSAANVLLNDRKLSSPAGFIKEIFGSGFNPVKFLTMDSKQRIAEILKALPIQLPPERISEIIGDRSSEVDKSQHPLKQIDQARSIVYDARKGYNAIVNESEKTITTLSKSLVEVDSDAIEKCKELTAQKESLSANILSMSQDKQAQVLDLQTKKQAEIDTINEKYASLLDGINSKFTESIAHVNKTIADINVSISELQAAIDLSKKQEYTRDEISRLKTKVKSNNDAALNLSFQIDKLDALKSELTSTARLLDMQISITNNELCVDGIPFDRINTALKIRIAMNLAKMNMGTARFAIIDGAECLDQESLNLIYEEAKKEDIQLLLFGVSESQTITYKNLGE